MKRVFVLFVAIGCAARTQAPSATDAGSSTNSSDDPCDGVMPSALPVPVTLDAPLDRVPFQDNFIGDGSGTSMFTLSFATPPDDYARVVVDSRGNRLATASGQHGDWSHPRVLPQDRGFLFLEGLLSAPVVLHQFSTDGTDVGSIRLAGLDHTYSASALDPTGGALIVTDDVAGPGGFSNAWQIFAQRFAANLAQKTDRTLVVEDLAGSVRVQYIAGAVTPNGWTFVLWTTFGPADPSSLSHIHGAWLPPSRTAVIGPFEVGNAYAGTNIDVQPLAGAGVGIATGTGPNLADYTWMAQIKEGSAVSESAGWLSAFSDTRLGIVRGGRANAILRGAPYWPGLVDSGSCERAMPIPLVSAGGTSCGTLSLPIQFPAGAACINAVNDAALGKDGTVIVQTSAAVTDAQGTHNVGFTTAWPQLLK